MSQSLKFAFLEFVRRHELIAAGERILVAVSGGIDSVVLLHLLRTWQPYLNCEIAVAHFNHQLRGAEANTDEDFVKALAARENLPFFSDRADTRALAERQHISLEAAGRQLRLAFLNGTALQEGFHKIATAHHMDDQAETMLMRLIQGSGVEGMAGIRLRRDRLIRPLLFATRSEIEAYARENDLAFREDATNTDVRFLRNRIRRELLPFLRDRFQLEDLQPLLHQSLILQDWLSEIDRKVAEAREIHLEKISQNKIRLEISAFRGYFSGIQVKLVSSILEELIHARFQLSYNAFWGFMRWLQAAPTGHRHQLTPEIFVYRDAAALVFERQQRPWQQIIPVFEDIAPGESVHLPYRQLVVSLSYVSPAEVVLGDGPETEFLDAGNMKFPLRIRNWQPGDRFKPLGTSGDKKVKDFLTDCKIRTPYKSQVPVLVNMGEIVCVLGVRISEDYKVTETSQLVVKLEIRTHESTRDAQG